MSASVVSPVFVGVPAQREPATAQAGPATGPEPASVLVAQP